MTTFDLQSRNEAQPSCYSNCFMPFGTTKDQQEAYFGNAGVLNSVTDTSGNDDLFLNDAIHQLFKTNCQPQHEQLQQEKTKELDDLLAQSMAELTFQERQQQQEVLHGVASEITEDESQIETWLQKLDQRLQHQRITRPPGDSKISAYRHALETNPAYVQDRELRLMFLRGNQYNPKSAADQMIRFFAAKEGLFGRNKLCKDITLEDMDEDDRTAIACGQLQVLGHDQAGRQMMLEFTSLRSECPTQQSELRAKFYLFLHVLKNNPSNQIKGIVLILYGVDKFQDQSGGKGFVENTSLALCLPIWMAGVHLCNSNPAQYLFSSGALSLAPALLRARFKVHFGSHLECQYLLSTYGIPVETLPLVPKTNEARLDYHWQWYRECFMKECISSSTEGEHPRLPEFLCNLPYIPRPTDVLFHRRKSNNRGSQRLRALTRHLLQAYNSGNKGAKRELVDYMMNDIANNGGRFLKQDDTEGQHVDGKNNDWKLADESEIREKITQMFRNYRRQKIQQQQKLQQKQRGPGLLLASYPSQTLTSPAPSVPPDSLIHDQHNDADVLFGRKRNNAGNKLVRKLVAELSHEYKAANRARKGQITRAIVDQVHALGGRFLRKTESGERWEEVGTDFARAKISKHFRNHRRPPKLKQSSSSVAHANMGASRANS